MKKIEENNTLVFICDIRANKAQIKEALKKLYDIDTVKINTLIRYVLQSRLSFSPTQGATANVMVIAPMEPRRLSLV
jgi:ribosomal protein L23